MQLKDTCWILLLGFCYIETKSVICDTTTHHITHLHDVIGFGSNDVSKRMIYLSTLVLKSQV